MGSVGISLLLFFLVLVTSWAEPVVRLEEMISGLDRPVFVTHAGDGSNRLFVVEQRGRVLVWNGESVLSEPFLNLSNRVSCCGERGLLGLAFHPNFAENGRFFVNYTFDAEGQLRTRIAEYSVSSTNQNVANPTEKVILEFDQPFSNHNGGMIAFGLDGNLYIATGDGGNAGDPLGNAQNLQNLLGKILRINIDATEAYEIPPDNPFYGQKVRNEIWAYGLRNPWRFSFDRLTGLLMLGDVGQSSWEEVDIITRGGNYGWNEMEGSQCYSSPGCRQEGLTRPVLEYPTTNQDRGVTGGYVYRGRQKTPLWGSYIFADHASGRLWSLTPSQGEWRSKLLLDTSLTIVSFGEDEQGELHVVDLAGAVYRLKFAWRELFAHVAAGPAGIGQFYSILTVVNPNNEAIEITHRLRRADGSEYSERTTLIPPSSAEEVVLAENSDFFVGWAELFADRQFFGSLLFSLETNQGDLLQRAGIASSEPGRHFLARASWNGRTGTDTGF
ncbi:MAG TPA: PQQ-dependent sugar dehydrogenase, partial [Acidobacteriota bacterium]|nr:PQQ-dependent sugar dehydrogenase [Acidobacteriota bacterium]